MYVKRLVYLNLRRYSPNIIALYKTDRDKMKQNKDGAYIKLNDFFNQVSVHYTTLQVIWAYYYY